MTDEEKYEMRELLESKLFDLKKHRAGMVMAAGDNLGGSMVELKLELIDAQVSRMHAEMCQWPQRPPPVQPPESAHKRTLVNGAVVLLILAGCVLAAYFMRP